MNPYISNTATLGLGCKCDVTGSGAKGEETKWTKVEQQQCDENNTTTNFNKHDELKVHYIQGLVVYSCFAPIGGLVIRMAGRVAALNAKIEGTMTADVGRRFQRRTERG